MSTTFDTIELRRYAMHPDRRDTLIALFERAFIETQEAAGMIPVGHYRDRDDPDAFIWFRAFARMDERHHALEAFYTSRTWLDHRDEANATLVDSDNVLLLRDARAGSGFDLDGLTRPALASMQEHATAAVVVSIFMLERPADDALLTEFERSVLPELHAHAHRIGYFVTDPRPNAFPRLPVREGEQAFVVTGSVHRDASHDAWSRAIDAWKPPEVTTRETLRLVPAARSLYR